MVRGHGAAVKSRYKSINVCIFNTYVRTYLHVYMGGESARARVRELVCVSMGLCACGCMHVRERGWLGFCGCMRERKKTRKERAKENESTRERERESCCTPNTA